MNTTPSPAPHEPALIVLIGVAGAGKSTLAACWHHRQVLSLDALREWVSDDDCGQDATADAVTVLHTILAARMRRRLTTVVDATNLTADARRPLLELRPHPRHARRRDRGRHPAAGLPRPQRRPARPAWNRPLGPAGPRRRPERPAPPAP